MSPNPRSGKLQLQSSLHSEFSYTCTATYHCHPEQLAATLPDTPRLWLLSFRHCHSTMGSLHWCWCIENICTCNRTPGTVALPYTHRSLLLPCILKTLSFATEMSCTSAVSEKLASKTSGCSSTQGGTTCLCIITQATMEIGTWADHVRI